MVIILGRTDLDPPSVQALIMPRSSQPAGLIVTLWHDFGPAWYGVQLGIDEALDRAMVSASPVAGLVVRVHQGSLGRWQPARQVDTERAQP